MESFSTQLLIWYDQNARKLPWRIPPQDSKVGLLPDPYHVWLSEVMLQQTTVATVKSYFDKFIANWPRLEDLAAASEEDVLRAWAGLGYYSRARNLKKCADQIVSEFDGIFPTRREELIKLPGIGPYTSAAISTIAFGVKSAVVDGNIERVVTRFTDNSTPLPLAKKDCEEFMQLQTPEQRPGDFAQAMMDLGATICTPRKPVCGICPILGGCASQKSGTSELLPVKAPQKIKPVRKGAAYILMRSDGALWLQKRPDKGLLAGMTQIPTTNWTVGQDGELGSENAPIVAPWISCGEIRHTFTHFHLKLQVWKTISDAPLEDGWWANADTLGAEALPTVMKKAISLAMPKAFQSSTIT